MALSLDKPRLDNLASNKLMPKFLTYLTACRKSLIHECVTGQRRITDADVRRVNSESRAIERESPTVVLRSA